MLETASLDLDHGSKYRPQAYTKDHDSQDARLSRKLTHLSEMSHVSRIISNIRDDLEQDVDDHNSYHYRTTAAAAVVDQLDRSSLAHTEEKPLISDPSQDLKDTDYPKDGKFAVWQAFLVMLLVFSTWGANASFGVFLNYYMSSNSFPGATNYDYALIGGIVVFLAQFLAPVSGLLNRFLGQTPALLIGLCLQVAGYLLASFCTQLWQIYCCQGVFVGVSFALIFIPGTLLLPSWFDKKKSFAMGFAVSGAGLGGVVFTLSINKIIQITGNQRWPLRAVCFMTLSTTIIPIVFLRPRNKGYFEVKRDLSMARLVSDAKIMFDFSVFKDRYMILLGAWFGVALLCYVIVLYSFSAYASSVGISHKQSNYLLAILNAAQVVGRPLVGNMGDKLGRCNVSIAGCAYIAIMILAFWRNATSYAALIVLAVLLGGPVGIGSTMAQSLAADILETQGRIHLLPAAWSGLNIIVGLFALPSEVIAIALKDPDSANTYNHAQIFAGCVFLLAMLLLLLNREYLVRKTFERRRAAAQAAVDGEKSDESVNGDIEAEDKIVNMDTEELMEQRIKRYNTFLTGGVKMYFARMFYPVLI